ncbi:hydroxyethylthiazole kinase, partial [Leptospira sp. 96542]|nr:hydroxyethylthiazole kinase [Leptospira sp. 96542]
MSKQIIQNTIDDLTKLREISPLVHNITNYV